MLAIAQSTAVARAIERENPGVSVELVGIETQGDRILDVPLSKIEGKEFFVAELDQALLNGDVDLTVHSMKDLSLERPDNIVLAAIPARENPRDVVLFGRGVPAKLAAGEPLVVGTSSPRRIENLEPFLARALPDLGHSPQMTTKEIRGNVNTRISFLSLPDDDPKKIDAVVLAFAGLNRLWADAAGHDALTQLLDGLRWMLLPLKAFPTAPAQGALAIECRAVDIATRGAIGKLHCADTQAAVAAERQILNDWGGGCHQRFGATSVTYDGLGSLLFIRGRKPDDTFVEETRWSELPAVPAPRWDGANWRDASFSSRVLTGEQPPAWLTRPGATFIAHSRALPDAWISNLRDNLSRRVWTSGVASWLRLASQGIWVEGCAEEFGFEALQPTLRAGVLQLPEWPEWTVLSHNQAVDTWPGEQVTATYEVQSADAVDAEHPAVIALREARSVFWTSASQFELFREWIPENCQHACRYGKTYFYLRDQGLSDLVVFPDVSEWRQCEESC